VVKLVEDDISKPIGKLISDERVKDEKSSGYAIPSCSLALWLSAEIAFMQPKSKSASSSLHGTSP
jgi:hypothetical protein